MNADVQRLLGRLDKVKATGPDRWTACCPAHADKSPSLSIRLADDGKLLVKCWTGCDTGDVLAAVGLSLSDLFPDRPDDHYSKPLPPGQRWVPRDVLGCVAREALVAFLAADQLARGIPLEDDDVKRLAAAAGRLRAAAEGAGHDFRR